MIVQPIEVFDRIAFKCFQCEHESYNCALNTLSTAVFIDELNGFPLSINAMINWAIYPRFNEDLLTGESVFCAKSHYKSTHKSFIVLHVKQNIEILTVYPPINTK